MYLMKNPNNPLFRSLYRGIEALVRLVYPKIQIVGAENLPPDGCILVGNHAQLHGPITAVLYIPGTKRVWCAHEMMEMKLVPDYAYEDFWRDKPRSVRWLFRLCSYLIAPIAVLVFHEAPTIPVYRDSRVLNTLKKTVSALENGENVVIFPEGRTPHNQIVNRFQPGFVDAARLYTRRTGKPVSFVPMYLAPALKTLVFGKPIPYEPGSPIGEQLMEEITKLATALPRHRVVPYDNLPKKRHPFSKELTQ